MASIGLDHVGKVYEDGTRAVSDLNIEVDDGELVVFVGPSGRGKTTTLRMIAGLETITEGRVRIGERVVNNILPRPRHRHGLPVVRALPAPERARKLEFGLQLRKVPKPELRNSFDHRRRWPRQSHAADRSSVSVTMTSLVGAWSWRSAHPVGHGVDRIDGIVGCSRSA